MIMKPVLIFACSLLGSKGNKTLKGPIFKEFRIGQILMGHGSKDTLVYVKFFPFFSLIVLSWEKKIDK